MKIALDAMGGDRAPEVVIDGAVQATRQFAAEIVLVGRRQVVESELARHQTAGLPLSVVHADQVVEMEEHPASAVKTKKASSIVVGMDLVKAGEADAFVSAGNTGAVMAAALLRLGRIGGVKRPALSVVYPSPAGPSLLLDIGANTDCKAEWLVQFALMGHVYAEKVLGIDHPRVALLSIGEEETKGSQIVQDAHQTLKGGDLNFIGNVEGRHIPLGGADVIVADGFAGNVVIKLSEGLAKALTGAIRQEIERNPVRMLGGLLAKGAFDDVRKMLDYAEYGGGALLGVDGVVIIGHGRSNAKAVKNAVGAGIRAVEQDIVWAIKGGIGER